MPMILKIFAILLIWTLKTQALAAPGDTRAGSGPNDSSWRLTLVPVIETIWRNADFLKVALSPPPPNLQEAASNASSAGEFLRAIDFVNQVVNPLLAAHQAALGESLGSITPNNPVVASSRLTRLTDLRDRAARALEPYNVSRSSATRRKSCCDMLLGRDNTARGQGPCLN